MRIALLSWETLHSIPVGGVGVHVTELAAALERKGHDVHVFTRMGAWQQPYQRIDGVHYHRCPFPLNADFVAEVDDMCRSFVDHVLQTEGYIGAFDVIHAHDWLAANAMIWLKQGCGRKTVFTIHSTEYGRCGNEFYGGRSEHIRAHERAGGYWADRVITVSHSLKKEVMWMYEVPEWKISVMFNGVNLHQFDGWIDPKTVRDRYRIGPMDPMILFVGRMVYQKGPDILVEAIPSVLGYYPQAKFVFVGDGEMRPHVQWRVEQMGLAHAVRFLGFKSGWELSDLFKACDAVCVPSRNEPFGIVVLEAWSAGKPVIATVNGGPRELIWHEVTGLTITPWPDSVAWGVGTLFTNFDWARWMGSNGRNAVEKAYTWDAVADSALNLYAS
jgi:glycosyltransferase involved in cell wall biosynthesis